MWLATVRAVLPDKAVLYSIVLASHLQACFFVARSFAVTVLMLCVCSQHTSEYRTAVPCLPACLSFIVWFPHTHDFLSRGCLPTFYSILIICSVSQLFRDTFTPFFQFLTLPPELLIYSGRTTRYCDAFAFTTSFSGHGTLPLCVAPFCFLCPPVFHYLQVHRDSVWLSF